MNKLFFRIDNQRQEQAPYILLLPVNRGKTDNMDGKKKTMNWNLSRVKQLIKEEADADTIMLETGIKRSPLQAIVSSMNQRNKRFYNIRGLFKNPS